MRTLLLNQWKRREIYIKTLIPVLNIDETTPNMNISISLSYFTLFPVTAQEHVFVNSILLMTVTANVITYSSINGQSHPSV